MTELPTLQEHHNIPSTCSICPQPKYVWVGTCLPTPILLLCCTDLQTTNTNIPSLISWSNFSHTPSPTHTKIWFGNGTKKFQLWQQSCNSCLCSNLHWYKATLCIIHHTLALILKLKLVGRSVNMWWVKGKLSIYGQEAQYIDNCMANKPIPPKFLGFCPYFPPYKHTLIDPLIVCGNKG